MKTIRAAKLPANSPLVAALLVLLVLLASLQYYWLGEVSAGERERLQSLVDTGATRFGEDFDLEVAGMFLGLQMHAETVRTQAWERYAQRYDHWRTHSAHANLVGDIYLVQMFENGAMRLARYNRTNRRFTVADWPTSMQRLRERFEQSMQTVQLRDGLLVGNTPDPVADDVPGLVIPVAHMELLSDPQSTYVDADIVLGETITKRKPCPRCKPGPDPVFAYTVVAFDLHYLWQHFVPALMRRYFANGDVLDYNVAIVSRRDPDKLVYHSNAGVYETAPPKGDATAFLFSLRLDEINRLLIDDTLRLGNLPDIGDRQSWRIAVGRAPFDDPSSGAALAGDNGGRWRLILNHRSGSLEAAVAGLRVKNLLISSVILLLLGASVVTMAVSARRSQRLAQQKIEFVAAISHELRTPLAVICSAGENLADGVVPDPQRARQYGAVIHNEGRRLAEMVDQALEYAGVQSGRKTYVPRPMAVAELLKRAVAACEPQLHDHKVTLDLQLAADMPPVLADPAEMTRAIQNLIRNAIKYGGEQRWVSIQARSELGARGPEVAICVRDAGMGIASEDLPHIFEPFYRSREAVAAQIHGSGLGLSLVRHIVEAHGGRITVESSIGAGSAFTVYLPCAANDGRQPTADGAQAGVPTRRRLWG